MLATLLRWSKYSYTSFSTALCADVKPCSTTPFSSIIAKHTVSVGSNSFSIDCWYQAFTSTPQKRRLVSSDLKQDQRQQRLVLFCQQQCQRSPAGRLLE